MTSFAPSGLRLLACLVTVFATLATSTRADDRPNIVLIFADDLGWKDVSWQTSSGFIETPNLDRLRKDGMMFTAAYAGAGNCAPSRACLLSGKYTPRHGIYAVGDTDRGPKNLFRLSPVPNTQRLRPGIVTIAEALKGLGYATGHFGKWHVGSGASGTGPRQQGFDVSPPGLIPPGDAAEDDEGVGRRARRQNKKQSESDDPKKAFSITAAACDFITQNKDRPFFAYVSHHAVHSALQARPETLARFREKARTAAEPHVTALLAACIFDLDDSVGRLLAKLSELDLDRKTLVVFTSDNGGPPPSTNEPLRGAKGGYYEGGIREPFLVRWPATVKPGSSSDTPVINLDLYSTFVAAGGGTPAPDLDGENLLSLFRGESSGLANRALFWHFPGYLDKPVNRGRDPVFRTRPVSVIRKGDWKLHLYHEEWLLDGGKDALSTNKAVEVYNLERDPGERTDLANAETAIRDELLGDLLAWMDKTKATLPTKR
jgi:arylsulfatase A-like enzyme